MSADNWAICPRCKQNTQRKDDELRERFQSSYGSISQSEYQDLLEQVK